MSKPEFVAQLKDLVDVGEMLGHCRAVITHGEGDLIVNVTVEGEGNQGEIREFEIKI